MIRPALRCASIARSGHRAKNVPGKSSNVHLREPVNGGTNLALYSELWYLHTASPISCRRFGGTFKPTK